ncbi:MAG: UDP-N-acetylmuramate dehydrogenase [Peptococcaceae bacterium]|jgi:UDP-N-acetylmuramate dehydrogenase|nr:UDP-N-acetylmuramate dehydrogenase [Peptococcaceae bacterium]
MLLAGLSGRVEREYPLARVTTWQIGGPAEICFWPESQADLLEAAERAQRSGIPVHILGNGSNVLAADQGIRGLVIVTTKMRRLHWGQHTVQAECGCMLNGLAWEAGRRGWSGLEFACGIPGTAGGAIRMNAGAYGREIADTLLNVTLWRPGSAPEVIVRTKMDFAYRSCVLRAGQWILGAEFQFSAGDTQKIIATMETNLAKRKEAQPLESPNAGSIFRNPPGDSAGRLIEAAGWKGHNIGGALVSPQHANFIINMGAARADEVKTLIEEIRADVARKYQVELLTEIHFLTD